MHPSLKIVCLFSFLLLINLIEGAALYSLCILVSVFAAVYQLKGFKRLVGRMSLFFISIFFIYTFATPGEYVSYFPAMFAPTYEGVSQGLMQIARLLAALAALSVLFFNSDRQNLMSGLSTLLKPLQLLGFNTDRLTARLILTFHYVEAFLADEKHQFSMAAFSDELKSLEQRSETVSIVTLPTQTLSQLDKLLIVVLVSGLILLLLRYWA